jgi:ABC-type multidrug transport system fused ATPase/permease subunit
VFYAYIRLGHDLQLSVAFTTLMLFGIIQEPVMWLPSVAQSAVQANTAAGRIKAFLLTPPAEPYVQGRSTSTKRVATIQEDEEETGEAGRDGQDVALRMQGCSFSWKDVDDAPDRLPLPFPLVAVGGACSKESGGKASGLDGSGYELVARVEGQEHLKILSSANEHHDTCGDIEAGVVTGSKATRGVTLQDITLEVRRGQLVAVCGSVGSGKSSLLNALLGDMVKVSGDAVEVRGSVAYHHQQPWILSASIQDNILLGRDLEAPKLKAVLKACGLDVDVKNLADGLATEIGEKGINLSGGQKARVSLARSLYSDADIYLLDDPLSAVDANVSSIMFREGIKKYLRSKTVVLVTHQVQYLKDCDVIVIVEAGRIVAQGSYSELSAMGVNVDAISAEAVAKTKPDELPALGRARAASSARSSAPSSSVYSHVGASSDTASRAAIEGQAITASDELLTGSVKLSTYGMYFRAGGAHLYVIVLILALGTVVSSISGDYYLSDWGEAATEKAVTSGQTLSNAENITYLQNYAWRKCIGIGTNALVFFFGLRHSFRVGNKVHAMLLTTVLGGTIAYFDTTPQGRIFTRFSNYLTEVDTTLVINTLMTITGLATLLGALGSIAYSTSGIFLILLMPLAYIYIRIYQAFTKTNTGW